MDKLTQAKQFTNLLEVAVIDQRLVNQVTLLFLCLLYDPVLHRQFLQILFEGFPHALPKEFSEILSEKHLKILP